MTNFTDLPPISFYVSRYHFPTEIPTNIDEEWRGCTNNVHTSIIQTYLRLSNSGLPCELVNDLPEDGVVITHATCLEENVTLEPTTTVLLVCLGAGQLQSPDAQIHIVQNPLQKRFFKNSYFIPAWATLGLHPRNSNRGDRFKNLAYFGALEDLASELKWYSFCEQIHALDMRWNIITDPNRWHDYSDIDVILAVRSFSPQHLRQNNYYIDQPAIQLYNAWLANIPIIVGHEYAYQAEYRSELDYIQVNSSNAVVSALRKLRDNCLLRQAMIENARLRSEEVLPDRLINQWHHFLAEIATPAYNEWRSFSSRDRSIILAQNRLEANFRAWSKTIKSQYFSLFNSARLPYDLSEKL